MFNLIKIISLSLALNMSVFAADAVLTPREEALAQVSSLAAQGKIEELKKSFGSAFERGLTVNEAKDAFVQLYAYAGFPRSLNALNALMSFVNESDEEYTMGRTSTELPSDYNALQAGTKVQTKLVGGPVEGGVMDFAPDADEYLKAHLFGDIFARDIFTHKEREISTIAVLSSIPRVESQLRSHINMGRNAGLTLEQERAIIRSLESTIGKEEVTRLLPFVR